MKRLHQIIGKLKCHGPPLKLLKQVNRLHPVVGKLKHHVPPLENLEKVKRLDQILGKLNDGSTKTPQIVQIDGSDMMKGPKMEMQFNSVEELMIYYKRYAKQCGLGLMIQRSERGDDESVSYVNISCTCGRKVGNSSLDVAKPRLTINMNCKAMINSLKVEGM